MDNAQKKKKNETLKEAGREKKMYGCSFMFKHLTLVHVCGGFPKIN